MAAAPAWRVRVTEHAQVSPSDLINHPENFKAHPPSQRETLQVVLEEVGFVGEVLVSRRSGRILDGHLRVAEALRSGQPTIPVGYVDCESDDDEAAILATHDPLGALATADREKLAQLAQRTPASDPLRVAMAGLAARPQARARGTTPPSGPSAGGHLGAVGGLVYPVVIECGDEQAAELLLEELLEAGHPAYLLEASASSLASGRRSD